MNATSSQQGLSHLMEAATALAKLTNSAPSCSLLQQRPVVSSTSSSIAYAAATAGTSKDIFPERLIAILNDTDLRDIVTWLPDGLSFVIIRPDVFTEHVLPKFFPPVDGTGSASPKYPSFTRKLNRWGFRQALRGPDTGAFHHPLFRKDKPELCLEMVCQRSSRGRTAGPKKSVGNLPAKKRRVALLTKESLDAMDKEASTTSSSSPQTDSVKVHATVSVSDDSQSMRSSTTGSSASNGTVQPSAVKLLQNKDCPLILLPTNGITSNVGLVQRALTQRNEEERIRVAKVMLYHAYLQAVHQTQGN